MITCCTDCSKRYIGCHGKCEEYLRQRAEHDAERDVMRELQRKKDVTYGYVKERRLEIARRKSDWKRR